MLKSHDQNCVMVMCGFGRRSKAETETEAEVKAEAESGEGSKERHGTPQASPDGPALETEGAAKERAHRLLDAVQVRVHEAVPIRDGFKT